jgi:hypothetical protein
MAIIDHGAHGAGQWLAEAVATFGLLLTIFGCIARTAARLEVAPPWHGGQRLRELVQARRASRFKRRLRGGQPVGRFEFTFTPKHGSRGEGSSGLAFDSATQ